MKAKRTAREIKVSKDLIDNKDVNILIGTVTNRDSPETIYLTISFWIKPKEEYARETQKELKYKLNLGLKKSYQENTKPYLINSEMFPRESENIYIITTPEDINYNGKKNFVSIELTIHTINIGDSKKMPLSNKKDTQLFMEAIKVSNMICNSDLLLSNKEFYINANN